MKNYVYAHKGSIVTTPPIHQTQGPFLRLTSMLQGWVSSVESFTLTQSDQAVHLPSLSQCRRDHDQDNDKACLGLMVAWALILKVFHWSQVNKLLGNKALRQSLPWVCTFSLKAAFLVFSYSNLIFVFIPFKQQNCQNMKWIHFYIRIYKMVD